MSAQTKEQHEGGQDEQRRRQGLPTRAELAADIAAFRVNLNEVDAIASHYGESGYVVHFKAGSTYPVRVSFDGKIAFSGDAIYVIADKKTARTVAAKVQAEFRSLETWRKNSRAVVFSPVAIWAQKHKAALADGLKLSESILASLDADD